MSISADPTPQEYAAIHVGVLHPDQLVALADFALAKLWTSEGCCPVCCGACAALERLLDAHILVDLMGRVEDHQDARCDDTGRLDTAWIRSRWADFSCPIRHGGSG